MLEFSLIPRHRPAFLAKSTSSRRTSYQQRHAKVAQTSGSVDGSGRAKSSDCTHLSPEYTAKIMFLYEHTTSRKPNSRSQSS